MLVGAALLAGCSTPTQPDSAIPSRYVEAPTISAAATQKYGDAAKAAYEEIAAFVLDESLPEPLLDPAHQQVTAAELTDGISGHLTPGTAAGWDQLVGKALTGDAEARDSVHVLRYYGLKAPNLKVPSSGSIVQGQSITGAEVDVVETTSGVVPLEVSFEQTARLRYLDGRSPYDGTLTRQLSFVVLPAATVAVPATGATSAAPTSAAPTTTEPTTTAPTTTAPTSGAAASPATGSPTSAPGTATGGPAVAYTRDPAADWLIRNFDGEVELDFDAVPSGATAAPTG